MRRSVALLVALALAASVLVVGVYGARARVVEAEAEADELDTESNLETEDGMPFWGDENTEVDDTEQHDEHELDADADADTEDSEDESDEEESEEAEAALELDTSAGADATAEDTTPSAVRAALSESRPASQGNGMAEWPARYSSLVEHEQRVRHDVPLQATTWIGLMAEAKNYHSNVLKSKAKTKGGPCAGVISAHCKHEVDMQPAIKNPVGSSSEWQEECPKLICNPLCLRYTWDVKIIASGGPEGFDEQVNGLGTQYSLGAQFRAHACGKIAGCCEENEDLLNWVELRNFGGMFPESPQPALACDLRANEVNGESIPTIPTKDSLCAQCKAAITIEATPKADACDYFVKVPDPVDMGDETEVFARNGESAAAEIPKHKSFQEKCKAVQGLMAGIISGLASGDWKEKACNCLGCCESDPNDSCYYPVVYGTDDEAHKVHKSL